MTPLQKRLLALTRSLGVPLTTLEKDVALGALLGRHEYRGPEAR